MKKNQQTLIEKSGCGKSLEIDCDMESMVRGSRDGFSISIDPILVEPHPAEHDNYGLGLFYMLTGIVIYSVMASMNKVLYKINPHTSAWDITLVRGTVSVIFISWKAHSENISMFDTKGNKLLMTIGTFSSCTTYISLIISYQYISITKASLIIYANPVIVVILAYFFLDEKILKFEAVAMAVVLFGTFLTVCSSDSGQDDSNTSLGNTWAIISCITLASTLVCRRKVNQRVSHYLMPFHMCLTYMVLSLPIICFTDWINLFSYSLLEFGVILVIAVSGLTGLLLTSLSYTYVEASKLAPFWNLEVVFLFLFESVAFSYNFALTDYIGGALILGGLMMTMACRG